MQQLNHFLSYFDPTTNKYEDSWTAFDTELTFQQQLMTITLTAIATIVSLPILGLGGLAAFRALVNHYTPLNPDDLPNTPMGTTAKKTQKKSEEILHEMTEHEFIEKALPCFDYTEDSDKFELEGTLIYLFKKYGSPATLLTAFKEGTKKERREALECSLKLHDSFNSAHEFKRLMRFAASIKSGRLENFDKLRPFCEGLKKTSDIQHIDRKLKELPPEEEEEILDAFSYISTQFDNAVDRAECLVAIKANIESGQRVEVIRENLDLLQFVSKSFYLVKVLKNLSELPPESREHVLSLAEKLSTKDDGGLTIDKIIRCVTGTPTEMHQQLLNNIEKCLEGITGESILPVIQILDQVLRLDAKERVSVVGVAMTHITSKMAPYERRLILSALLDVDSDSRSMIDDTELQEMIKVKKQVIQFFGRLSSSVNKQEIFAEINRIPENQREAFFADLAPVLDKIESAEAFKELINGVKMIAPQYRAIVIEGFTSRFDSTFKWKNLVQFAFERAPQKDEILSASKSYLRLLLENETDEAVARDIAQKIWDNRHTFGIHDEGGDELFAVLMAIVPIAEGHASSSYGVFRSHLKRDKEVKTPSIITPPGTIGGLRVRMDQPFFEKMIRENNRVTFGDLTETINLETLEGLFSAFEKRIAGLEQRQRNKAWTVGVSGCMVSNASLTTNPTESGIRSSYQNIKSTFMGSVYIRDMLKRKGDPSQQVPTGYLHLYAIVKFIKDSSLEINPRTGLSDQEEVLLKMLSSVQHCGTGKSEGCAEFYSTLPTHARFHGAAKGESRADKAKEYLAAVAQSVLAKYLEEEGPMSRELTGVRRDGQWVHSRKYLKNLIAKRIGLQWDIAFDAYPGCINGTLQSKSLEDVLRIFYKHVTPEKFLHDIIVRVNNDIVPNDDEIQELEERLRIAQRQLDLKQAKGKMPALLQEEKELIGSRQQLFLAFHQTAQKLRALRESDEKVGELEMRGAEQAKSSADMKWAEWQANALRNKEELTTEKARLGIPEIEKQIEAIELELDPLLEEVDQKIVNQLVALLSESSREEIRGEECWTPVASCGYKNTITPTGMANALIEAGYFAQV